MSRRIRGMMIAAFVSLLLFGCSAERRNRTQTMAQPTPRTQFEQDLDYVRKGQFIHIYVISRLDGEPFDSNDIAYLKANAHPETNMWVMTDDGRRVIAGTNFDWTRENFVALSKRFKIEDRTER
ncbi:hypothetical protein [Pyrinomonas methylaliphatogenes]|nr:hypothetical protein [Pyrinomonas methylaliphatogenes]